jgi:hypothetical protein
MKLDKRIVHKSGGARIFLLGEADELKWVKN